MALRKSRKRRHRQRKGGRERLPWIAAAAMLVLFGVSYLYNDGADGYGTSTDGSGVSQSQRMKRCRTSCGDVILTAASDGALPPRHSSPTALASSAVDALFLMHGADDSASSAASDQGYHGERQYETKSGKSEHDQRQNNGAALPGELTPPPSGRLPPLIETLVGAVDSRYHHGGRGYGQGSTGIIRIEGGYQYQQAMTSTSADKGGGGGDDSSVAMAAAAAAAAFWSSRTAWGGIGRHRMKVYNDEWDAALRWIAGWGQEQLAGGARATTVTNAMSTGTGRARDPIGRGEKGGQRKSTNHGTRSSAEEEADVALLVDVCVDECLGMTGDGGFEGQRSSLLDASHKRGRFWVGGDIILTAISLVAEMMASDRLIPVQKQYRIVLLGVVRFFFASIIFLGLRSTVKWLISCPLWPSWTLGGDHSHRWLEEEEMPGIGTKGSKKKSTAVKKGRRRKPRSSQASSSGAQRCAVSDSAQRAHGSESKRAKESDMDTLSIATSQVDHGGRWIEADSSRGSSRPQFTDTSEDSVAKRDSKASSDRGKGTTDSSKSTAKPSSRQTTAGGGKRRSLKHRNRNTGAQNSAEASHSNQAAQLDPKVIRKQHSERKEVKVGGEVMIAYPPVANTQNASSSNQRPLLDGLKQNSHVVPTDEQREIAARQLREYQRIQIQKLMERKKNATLVAGASRLDAKLLTEKTSYSATKKTSFSQAVSPTVVIGPPPGLELVQETKVTENTVASVDIVADSVADGLLLSDMLEEDDDGDDNTPSAALASPLPSRVSAFTASFSKFSVPSSSPGKNPWAELPLKVSLGASTGENITRGPFDGALLSMSSTLRNASEGGDNIEHAVASSTWSSSEGAGSESSSNTAEGKIW